jgi:filamentous hemagglutinin family protein
LLEWNVGKTAYSQLGCIPELPLEALAVTKFSLLSRGWQLKLVGSVAIVGTLLTAVGESVLAQIVPDNTLGAEGSVVTPDVINGILAIALDGGATRGANLFHSFSDFNVGEGRGAYFANPIGIENILTRVTGGNPSNILGRLGVLGGANLFLLNPNGILFGANSSLDIQGSFLASTASSFTFPDGSEFSATNPQVPPLLTISVPLGLQYGSNPGSVQVQGSNLQVNPGKTLALVGGNVSMDGGQLQASDGRIELGGVAGEGTVGLSIDGSNIGLSFPISDGVPLSNVSLDNSTLVKVDAGGDGNIAINAQNLRMAGESRLQAGASWLVSSNSNPGDIAINATGAINLTEASFIENLVFTGAMGKGGDINITAGSLAVTNGAKLGANTFGNGDAGNLNIIVRDRVSFEGMGSNAESVVASTAEGQAGQINITARSVSISGGATLVANTSGRGNAGNVTISATDAVSLEGSSTGIGSQVLAGAVGDGGSIDITTGTMSLSSGATLVIDTSGQGDGGSINITTGTMSLSSGATLAANTSGQGNAGDVTISATDAVSLEGSSTAIGSQVLAGAVGNGGSIDITTDTMSISGGATLVANTSGRGNAGNVTISATDAVFLEGSSTGIGSQVLAGAVGNGGSIDITTGTMSVSGGATLVIDTSGQGDGGSINITTGTMSLSSGGTLAANTSGQGNAGDVTISATDAVFLEGSSTAIGSQVLAGAVGNGGSIDITTDTMSVSGGATLVANTSGQGNAGNVTISATDAVSLEGSSTGIGSQVLAGAVGNGGSIDITTGTMSVSGGATLVANTSGQGNAGNVTISATDAVSLEGSSTGIGSQVLAGAVGNGGSIDITTDTMSVSGGATLVANTSGQGSAGNVTIRATDIVSLDGVGTGTQVTGIGSQVLADGVGNGGNIEITAGSLAVTNGARLIASTSGQGNGGDVNILVRNAVSFVGVGSNGKSSGVFSSVEVGGVGEGGDINVTTNTLSVANGAVLDAQTQTNFKAGDIIVNATQSVNLNQASLLAQSTDNFPSAGTAGEIRINTGNLTATNGTIATSTTKSAGGAITITLEISACLVTLTSEVMLPLVLTTAATSI